MFEILMAAGALIADPAQLKLEKQNTFTQSGIASYYSDYYNGRTTASGSIFSNSSNQCAHRTLSFGTELKITNLDTGAVSYCKVSDRGPFVRGRIVDLSKLTFSELAPLSQGLIDVQIEVVN